ncbi:carboxymuconolactone decarboxylase family protein [Chitinophaga sp. CF418]|uniref:carboxymuconolactone decarboxylase family protein n=1 Tax=Chitinophaga sp. CF418 TaxID=1855287 RepID=UPI0009222028|nr:carboxymuconolactone decarboxylase family protein [Chitinophaga sp. CF418]SHM84776.1 alkylhydroperoxidase AhpD family core domain-containing protein [Chitinophaga sp. CF418]
METRLNMSKVEPEAYKAMLAMEKYLHATKIAPLHKELIKIRASQINGCAYCIDMHTKDARKLGETEQRIYALNAWRETPFFSQEERAILALTEEVTRISNHVSDATYNEAIQVLGEQLTAQVMMAAVAINSWNRIGIATRMMPA